VNKRDFITLLGGGKPIARPNSLPSYASNERTLTLNLPH